MLRHNMNLSAPSNYILNFYRIYPKIELFITCCQSIRKIRERLLFGNASLPRNIKRKISIYLHYHKFIVLNLERISFITLVTFDFQSSHMGQKVAGFST